MIKGILFDFDDTLGDRDAYAYTSFKDLIDHVAKDFDPLTREAMIQDCMLYDCRGNIGKSFVFEQLNRKYNLGLDPDDALRWWVDTVGTRTLLFPNAWETLTKLSEKYILACVTNGPTVSQNEKIDNCHIRPFFKFILTGEEAHGGKPGSEIFERAVAMTGLKKEEILFVGDTFSTDMLGAGRYGLHCLWMVNKNRPCAYPIDRIEHIEELIPYLESWEERHGE